MRMLCVVAMLALLVPVGPAAGQARRSTANREPAPIRGCLDQDLVLWANESFDQAQGAPFWVDESHQFELLGEREMLADLEQHIGHEVDITLLLEWESDGGPQPIAEPVAPGAGLPGQSGGVAGLPGGFGGRPRGPVGVPRSAFSQPSTGGASRSARAPAIPGIMTEFEHVSLACRRARRNR
jgi:hypothetical protein